MELQIALITGILTGLLSILGSWLIMKSRFNSEEKKEQKERLREILQSYLKSFLTLRFHLNRLKTLMSKLYDVHDENYLLKYEENIEDIILQIEKFRVDDDLTATLLFIYDIKGYEKDIKEPLNKIQTALDDFPDDQIDTGKEKFSNDIKKLDKIIAEQYHYIEKATKKIYPK